MLRLQEVFSPTELESWNESRGRSRELGGDQRKDTCRGIFLGDCQVLKAALYKTGQIEAVFWPGGGVIAMGTVAWLHMRSDRSGFCFVKFAFLEFGDQSMLCVRTQTFLYGLNFIALGKAQERAVEVLEACHFWW